MSSVHNHDKLRQSEITYAVISFAIGVGILVLPREIGQVTQNFDGWMSIVMGGLGILFFTWIVASLASRFPGKTFVEYAGAIVSKPVAVVLTMLVALNFLIITSYETRMFSQIAKNYLFNRTPIEVVSLIFLLVVVYAVAGSSIALLRLNMIFLPIIITILVLMLFFNIHLLEIRHFKPFFTTQWSGILKGAYNSIVAFIGFEILLFYVAMMQQPKQAVRAALVGMSVPFMFNLLIHFFVIGQLGHLGTINMIYPTIEMAKETEVPGGFFTRFESIFFTVWIMAIFTTTAMAYDVTLIALRSVFKKVKRMNLILLLTPIILLLSLMPKDHIQIAQSLSWLIYLGITTGMVIPLLLLIIAKFRGVKGNG